MDWCGVMYNPVSKMEFTCTVADQHHQLCLSKPYFYHGIAPIAQSLNGKPNLDPKLAEWPPIGKIAAHSAYDMFSLYKYLIVSLVFSHLGFWSGNLFLTAPFPDLCLPFDAYVAIHTHSLHIFYSTL